MQFMQVIASTVRSHELLLKIFPHSELLLIHELELSYQHEFTFFISLQHDLEFTTQSRFDIF